tara:strand:- start:1405 stop:1695 length:291 start_codon:yes stop_codon:yes gene_type:complete
MTNYKKKYVKYKLKYLNLKGGTKRARKPKSDLDGKKELVEPIEELVEPIEKLVEPMKGLSLDEQIKSPERKKANMNRSIKIGDSEEVTSPIKDPFE